MLNDGPALASPSATGPPDATAFEQHTSRALVRLRSALMDLIGAVASVTPARTGRRSGAPVQRPADLQRALGIPGTLAWQMWRIAHADDPIACAGNLPGPHALDRVLDAAERLSVPRVVLDEVRGAQERIDELIRVHAGSRAAFNSMLGSLREESRGPIDLNHRRIAFTANSHIWGVQTRVRFATFVYYRSQRIGRVSGVSGQVSGKEQAAGASNPGTCHLTPDTSSRGEYDAIGLRGLIGLRRLRPGATCTISSSRSWHDHTARQPLDREAMLEYGAPIVRAFSSQPPPPLRTVTSEDGMINVQLSGDGIGALAQTDCVLGEIFRPAGTTVGETFVRSHAGVQVPCEALVQDVLVEDGAFGEETPKATLYSDLRGTLAMGADRESDRLPMMETVRRLGRGLRAATCNDIPGYREIIRESMQRASEALGEPLDPERFDVYRLRIEYPVLPSTVVIRFDLPGQ